MIPLALPDISEKEINAVVDVLKSWHLALWPKLKEFEEVISKRTWAKYASAVCNWTAGLHLIVKSLWIGENDAVFVPSFTFISSVNCFVFEWAYPLFVDIEEDTYNLDPEFIIDYISKNTTFENGVLTDIKTKKHIKAIVGVHVFGHPFNIDAILEICNKYNLYLIEDSAEALWSEYKGKKCGIFWEASIYAFYPNKQFTTWEWWIITTNNEKYYKLFESLKNQWRWSDMQWLSHDKIWYNYRLSDINAAVWVEQIKRFDEILEKRENVVNLYEKYFEWYSELVRLPIKKEYCTKLVVFVYVIQILVDIDINFIIEKLAELWIQSKNYFSPIHLQKIYIDKYWFNEGLLPITEKIAKRTLAIPFYNNLKEDQIEYIVEKIISLLKS